MLKFKNHIILCIIYVFTVFLTFYFCLLYKNSSVNSSSSKISSYISDVTDNSYEKLFYNIKNYSDENDYFYLYVASYKKNDLSSFEDRFMKVISDNRIKNIIYINIDEFKDSNYLEKLVSDFGGDNSYSVTNFPLLMLFEHGGIVAVYDLYQIDDSFLNDIMEVK